MRFYSSLVIVSLSRYLSVLSNIESWISFPLLIYYLALNGLGFIVIIGAIVSSLGCTIYLLYKAIDIILSGVAIPIINLVTIFISLSASNTIGFSLLSYTFYVIMLRSLICVANSPDVNLVTILVCLYRASSTNYAKYSSLKMSSANL